MSKHIFSLLLALAVVLRAAGLTVESTPGNLADIISNASTVTELTITGSIDATDLDFIDTEMKSLRVLDLSGVRIAAYSGKRLRGVSSHVADRLPDGIFVSSPITTIVLPAEGPLTIGNVAFAGAHIRDLRLGSNIVAVGDGAFSNCPELITLAIATPSLGEAVFAGCTGLKSVSVETALDIPAYAFNNCPSLAEVKGSENITSIADRGFAVCTELKAFVFGSGLTEIGNEAFISSGLEEVDLSACGSLDLVGDWAFARMPALRSLNLGTADSVGMGVVFECPVLKNLIFSEVAEYVPDFAYTKNTAMDTTSLFNPMVTYIGRHAFSGMSQVTNLTLPGTLTYVDDNAMENMTSLQTLNLSANEVPATGNDVWAGVNQSEVHLFVPKGAADSYRAADQWQEFDIMELSGTNSPVVDGSYLRARFEGDVLAVVYSGLDVTGATLYDIDGSRLSPVASPATEGRVEIDAAGLQGRRVVIVSVDLASGKTVSLKIAKD